MFMSILRGQVNQENWNRLKAEYERMCHKPPHGVVRTFLIQDDDNPVEWRIVTLWESEEVFNQAGAHPCVQLFCNAGSTPVRTIYNVISQYELVSARMV
jgi:hypothetical protein